MLLKIYLDSIFMEKWTIRNVPPKGWTFLKSYSKHWNVCFKARRRQAFPYLLTYVILAWWLLISKAAKVSNNKVSLCNISHSGPKDELLTALNTQFQKFFPILGSVWCQKEVFLMQVFKSCFCRGTNQKEASLKQEELKRSVSDRINWRPTNRQTVIIYTVNHAKFTLVESKNKNMDLEMRRLHKLNLRTLFVAQVLKVCTAAGDERSGCSCHKYALDHALFIMNEMLYF